LSKCGIREENRVLAHGGDLLEVGIVVVVLRGERDANPSSSGERGSRQQEAESFDPM
jgi:hypothetical protein